MFKAFKRYVREHFERNVIKKTENVDNAPRKQSPCYCVCSTSYVPLLSKNQRFSYQPFTLKRDGDEKHQDENDKFKTNCLDQSWLETLGLSGTLAFGWAMSQNIDFRRRRRVDQFIDFYQNRRYHRLKRTLCPYYTLKNVFPKQILAQPNAILNVNVLVNSQDNVDAKLPLPVYGPLTAEETLNEASEGLRRARNTAAGELENRLGLRCMSKRRYRKAIIHFAAGSSLQNSSAAFNLAQCYELGLGTNKDFTKAAKCYRTASDLGNATATFNLAVFYAQGLGGLKCDLRKARELLEKAVELGDNHAKNVLETLMKNNNLQIESKVHVVSKETKPANEKTNFEKGSRAVSAVIQPILSTFQTPFSKITRNEVTKMDSCSIVSSVLNRNVLFSDKDDSKSSRLADLDASLKNEFGKKKSCNEIVDVYPLYTDDDKMNVLRKLPFYGEMATDISKKEFESPIPFLMKLYKIATAPGH